MVKNLGQYKALIMQISDLFVVGDTIAQAFGTMHLLRETCEIQFIARAGSGPPTAPPPETCEHAARQFDNIRGFNETVWASKFRMLDQVDPGFRD